MRTLLVLALCLSSAFAITDLMGNTSDGSCRPATPVLGPNLPELNWQTWTDMPTARFGAAVAAANGMLFAVGGYGGSRLTLNEAYDPNADTWGTKAPMANARNGCYGAALDGWVYVVGGYNGSVRMNIVEGYDVTADSWYTLPNMSLQRAVPAAVGLNGKLYVLGGFDGTNYHQTVERYDPASNTWDTVAPMPTGRCGLAAAVLDGKIYTVGGWTGADPTQTELEMYDPDGDSWTSLPPMPTGRMYLTAAAFGGYLFAIGGQLSFYGGYTDIVECYDPQAGEWTSSTSMPIGRSSLGAATIDNKAHVVGGYNGSALQENDRAEIQTGISESPRPADSPMTLRAFPNPFRTSLLIHLTTGPLDHSTTSVRIYDAAGRLVASSSDPNSALVATSSGYVWKPSSDTRAGVYVVRVLTAECAATTRVVFTR